MDYMGREELNDILNKVGLKFMNFFEKMRLNSLGKALGLTLVETYQSSEPNAATYFFDEYHLIKHHGIKIHTLDLEMLKESPNSNYLIDEINRVAKKKDPNVSYFNAFSVTLRDEVHISYFYNYPSTRTLFIRREGAFTAEWI